MWAWHLAGAGPKVKDKERYEGGVHSAEDAQGKGDLTQAREFREGLPEKVELMCANLRDPRLQPGGPVLLTRDLSPTGSGTLGFIILISITNMRPMVGHTQGLG